MSKSWDEITTTASKEFSDIDVMNNTEDSSDEKYVYHTFSLKDYTDQQLKVRKSLKSTIRLLDKRLVESDHDSRMEGQHMSLRKPGEQGYASLPISKANNCDS